MRRRCCGGSCGGRAGPGRMWRWGPTPTRISGARGGAGHLTPLTLHLRPGVREEFMPWLEEAYPELVPDYRRLYRGSNAPRSVREELAGRVRAEKRRHRTFASPTTPATARRLPDPPP